MSILASGEWVFCIKFVCCLCSQPKNYERGGLQGREQVKEQTGPRNRAVTITHRLDHLSSPLKKAAGMDDALDDAISGLNGLIRYTRRHYIHRIVVHTAFACVFLFCVFLNDLSLNWRITSGMGLICCGLLIVPNWKHARKPVYLSKKRTLKMHSPETWRTIAWGVSNLFMIAGIIELLPVQHFELKLALAVVGAVFVASGVLSGILARRAHRSVSIALREWEASTQPRP
ncbi:hypothetical protein SH661x_001200 [Planctomicrobium sp. SH661]|uniref:hypothetical protein n=1 Tax=Planctomicrobium sp. SH661 TaxID=3448124 RepID=UPI003F5B8120